MDEKRKSTAKDSGGSERKITASNIQQENLGTSRESGLQENQQQYHTDKPSCKEQLHLYGDEESVQNISRARVQQIMKS